VTACQRPPSSQRLKLLEDGAGTGYLTNAYRVLLTRARQGMVIYIPKADCLDVTRSSEFYDGTVTFLSECGLPLL
jgi:hypothetical protein